MVLKPRQPETGSRDEAAALEAAYGGLDPREIVAVALNQFWAGELAAVSSFGADSAVLLHMIASHDAGLPVLFLDTGQHFEETLRYRDQLVDDLGLTDLRIVEPLADAISREDPDRVLHRADAEACCAIRKVEPMQRAVQPFKAWFTGRKRFQASTREEMPVFEAVGQRIRINPLASWGVEEIGAYMEEHGLRQNPLVAFGYLSIGCFPCTQPVAAGADPRSGRWAGQAKTECGIHLPGAFGEGQSTSARDH